MNRIFRAIFFCGNPGLPRKRTVSRTVRRTRGVRVRTNSVRQVLCSVTEHEQSPKEVRVRVAHKFLCVRLTFLCVFVRCSLVFPRSTSGKADQNWLPGVFAGCSWAVFVCFAHPLFVLSNNEQTPKSFVFVRTVSVPILFVSRQPCGNRNETASNQIIFHSIR